MNISPVIAKAKSPRSNAKYTLALQCPDLGHDPDIAFRPDPGPTSSLLRLPHLG